MNSRPQFTRTPLALVIAARLLSAPALSAQTPGTQAPPDEVVNLQPIIVIAHAAAQGPEVVIDPRAPSQPVPAHDGAGVLHAVPGFSIIRKGGTDGDPVFRGMAGSRLTILLDGENILGGCGNRMDPPTAYVFPAAYDRVTVVKGPQSVIHGPASSAGVVLFERVPPTFAAPDARLQAAFTLGSAERQDVFLEVVAGDPRFQARAAATRTESADYRDGDGSLVHARYQRWSAHVGAAWTPDRNTFLELSGLVSDGQAAYADRAMDGVAFARRNLGLRVRRAAPAPGIAQVEAQLFLNYVDHVMDNFSLREFTPTSMMPARTVSNPERETFGARASAVFTPSHGLEVTTGADWQGNRHASRSTSNESTDPYRAKPRIEDASFDAVGLFAETVRTLSDAQRVVLGARADLWSVQDQRTRLPLGMMGTMPNPTAGHERRATLGSGFLRYESRLGPDTTAFAGFGLASRFPDYWELFSKESLDSPSAFDADEEHTRQLDLGLLWRAGRLNVSVALFGADIQDYLLVQNGVQKPAGPMGTRMATIVRSIDAHSHGAESTVAWSHTSGWQADASVSWVHATNRTDGRPLAQQPPVEGRLALAYSTSRWSAGVLGRFIAGQTRVAPGEGNIVGQDLGTTRGAAVFSVHAACRLHDRLQLTLGVDNVLDRMFAEHLSRAGAMVAGFPPPTTRVNEPGRTAWLRADFDF